MVQHFRRDYAGQLTGPRSRVGIAARVHADGDPLRYSWGLEYRDVAELDSIVKQLPGKKVVVTHPDDSPGNHYGRVQRGAQAVFVGVVEAARRTDDGAEVDIRWDDDEGERAIQQGFRDLSLGYDCDVDARGYQFNTVVDHLAMVRRGRCRGPGGACEIRGDDACTCAHENENSTVGPVKTDVAGEASAAPVQGCACNSLANPLDVGQSANHMPLDTEKALMDEMNKKLAEAHAEAAAQKARADQAEKERDAEKVRADQAEKDRDQAKTEAFNARKDVATVQAEVDAAKARADQAEADAKAAVEKAEADAKAAIEKSRADAASELDAMISAKVALVTEASPIIGTNDKGEPVAVVKMSDRAIKCAVVLRVDGEDLDKMDPKPSDEFVAGVYAGAIKRHARAAGSRADARATIADTRNAEVITVDVHQDAENKAMEAMRASMADRWKNPASKDKE